MKKTNWRKLIDHIGQYFSDILDISSLHLTFLGILFSRIPILTFTVNFIVIIIDVLCIIDKRYRNYTLYTSVESLIIPF